MASRKVLKGVAHNFGHSFVSDATWSRGDYAMGHLLRTALAVGLPEVTVDLISGVVDPPAFRATPGGEYLAGLVGWFTEQWLAANHTSREFIASVGMLVRFDLDMVTPPHETWMRQDPSALEPGCPYHVVVTIVDDRGRRWSATQTGWQYPLKQPPEGQPRWL